MEAAINAYISGELISRSEFLPLWNDTPLLESGILDSLSMLKLVLFLEEHFGIAVGDLDFIPENFNTIDAICAFIMAQHQEVQR